MKMVIADDEILTLQLMEKIIDWDAWGINIVGTALNGKEAQSMIERDCPDILITDIRMPEIDGLELIRWIRDENINLKFIIISAYGEFEYAKRALNYGASGYLLKPVDEDELEKLLGKITNEIMREISMPANRQEEKPAGPAYNNIECHNHECSKLIQRAKGYIHSNYNIDIALEDICQHISVSKNYFCHLFKKEAGESIWDYLTRYRIEKAKEFLCNTEMKNYEIAYEIGYENPSYFTKTFKRLTGVTPQEYRERQ